MANETWNEETSALFVAEINSGVLQKAIAWLLGVIALGVAITFAFGDSSFWSIAFAFSLIPMYPMMEYVVVLVSVLNKVNLEVGKTLFFADRAGYRAKLKANPESRLYKPTRNQKLIAWGSVALMVIGLAAAMAS
jgi:hypothetical protein